MQKRGQLVIIALITLLVAAFVVFSYIQIARSLSTGKTALKVSAARDIALIIDTLYAYPYEVELEYDVDLSLFIVEISENSVKIYDSSFVKMESDNKVTGRDILFAQYNFAPTAGEEFEELNFIFDKPKKLIFKKINGKIKIEHIK